MVSCSLQDQAFRETPHQGVPTSQKLTLFLVAVTSSTTTVTLCTEIPNVLHNISHVISNDDDRA